MYNPRTGSEWIEVRNAGDVAVDVTQLQVNIGGTRVAIATHGSTQAELAAGGVAVIAVTASDITAANYPGYVAGPLYTSSFSLPEADNTEASIDNSSDEAIDAVTYSPDDRSNKSGLSLHLGLDNTIVPAPATPGVVAVNPVREYTPIASSISVSSSITDAGETGETAVFLADNSVITMTVLHTHSLPSGLAVDLVFGTDAAVEMEALSGGTEVVKRFNYTVASTNGKGVVRYVVKDSSGTLKTGALTSGGKAVVIDRDAPSATFTITEDPHSDSRREVVATITEEYPKRSVLYRMHGASCNDATTYDGADGEESVATLETQDGVHTVTIMVAGEDNNGNHVCLKLEDQSGKITYAASNAITGITDTLQISEIMYAPIGTDTDHEWVEVVNRTDETITLTEYEFIDGTAQKSISHVSGNASLSPDEIAIIARDTAAFNSTFSSYTGSLFAASFSLKNTEDTIALRKIEPQETVHTVVYTSSDGAKKNGKSLHITFTGDLIEGDPSPGSITNFVAAAPSQENQQPEVPGTQPIVSSSSGIPSLRVYKFDGAEGVPAGQNLFFTDSDTVEIAIEVGENGVAYANAAAFKGKVAMTFSDTNAVGSEQAQVTLKRNWTKDGKGRVSYDVSFSPDDLTAATDNRVTIQFVISGDEGTRTANVIVVRNTTAPTVNNGTSATVLGFAGEDAGNVIVPITVTGIPFGDYLQVSYGGTGCVDGSLWFIVRNGGYGIPYELVAGTRYDACTVSVMDTAGNESTTTIPTVVIGG